MHVCTVRTLRPKGWLAVSLWTEKGTPMFLIGYYFKVGGWIQPHKCFDHPLRFL